MQRVAVISLHTSPLAQPGSGDSGGMNVYVRELMSSLAQAGVECTTYTRADRPDLPREVLVEPNHRVVHVEAGDHDLPKERLAEVVPAFSRAVLDDLAVRGRPDVVHANYWLSGLVAHEVKHALDVPMVATFHTLARVKAEGGDPEPAVRERAEAELITCADAICVSCPSEEEQFVRLHGRPQGRIEIVAPGVEHAFFAPGDRSGARDALGLPADRPVLLFVGRIQPLKGPDLAVRALDELGRRHGYTDAELVIVGGSSGVDGAEETRRVRALVAELGLGHRVHFVDPQPHHILSTYYRAADVVLVPSRSESFGLVALEAAACGTPVVASPVGGLLSLIDHGRTGLLVAERTPFRFADATARLLASPDLARTMSRHAAQRAASYTWGFAAARLRRLYLDLAAERLVACS